MNKTIFKILYYIKKFLIAIILFCIIALFVCYSFLNSKQHYTASVTIEYTNPDATNGYAPDGTKIDPTEIMSSKNIANVIDDLNLSVSSDYIRNRLKITEIIPDEEKEKKEAALQNGDKYEYFPTEYEISFSVDSHHSKEFASDVLNSILSEYYIYYSENHINKETIPANTSTLLNKSYDYLETVEVMNNSISDIINYLSTQQTNYPDYRSSTTGYSFKDLYNNYSNISTENLPSLFSFIFQNKITTDYDMLINKYQNRINNNELEITNKESKLQELKSLIDSYAIKSKEQVQYQNTDENGNLIIQNVENDKNVDKTTYDNLILQYVDTLETRRKLDVDIDYCKNVLNIYSSPKNNSTEILQDLKKTINKEKENLNSNYEILEKTATELNEVLGAKNINTKTNLIVLPAFNFKIYILMAFIVFAVVGCCGAIVLGKLYDIIYKNIYYDKKTGLLNRTKCDQIINDYSKKPLNEDMYTIILIIKNLSEINITLGRETGDEVLKLVGEGITKIFPNNSELTYNGTNQFLLFIHNSSKFIIESYINEFNNYIQVHTKNDINIELAIGYTNPIDAQTYKIRELISKTYQKVKNGE